MQSRERIVNPNLVHLHNNYTKKSGALLEGSSRSGKTWSSVDFLIYLCSVVSEDAIINIIKETYNSFKTTLYDDFNRRLPMYGIQSPFADKQEVSQFKIFGNKINLLGANNETVFAGVGCDYAYFNEMLDINKSVFDDTEQRCRKFWWGDYNPKATEHWVYNNVAARKDVAFLKTTFLDNPYISDAEKRKILSYEPTHPEDRNLPFKQRRLHPTNIVEGTADDYRWNVYGLGLRSAPEGIIFQHVTWIDKFPDGIERVFYGSDLGYTNSPSTIVKVGVEGKNLYLEKLFHTPTPSPNEYIPAVRAHVPATSTLVVDSADALGFIMACRRAKPAIKVVPVNKFNGSIKFGIGLMKDYKIHIVDCPEWRSEQAGYRYKEVHGIKLDEPFDDNNHLWDAARYAVLTNLMR